MFSNAAFFRFTKPFQISHEMLAAKLSEDMFKPCGPQEQWRQGWTAPYGKLIDSEPLVYQGAGSCLLIALKHEERVIPPRALKQAVEEQAEAIEQEQGRKVRRKEKQGLKEDIMLQMLPHAPRQSRVTMGYLDLAEGCLIVDASTPKRAEEFASALRKSLGSLPVRPPVVEQSPAFTFTGWMQETIDLPDIIDLGNDCWLVDLSEQGGKITVKDLDLHSDEVRNHLDNGMMVSRLELEWDGQVSFVVDDCLHLRRVKYGEGFMEKLDEIDSEDELARFDAMFALASTELGNIFSGLFAAMGGEDRSAIVGEEEPVTVGVDMASGPDETVVRVVSNETVPVGFDEARSLVVAEQKAGISMIQRKLKIGYNHAARIMDALEEQGVVSRADHNGARKVLEAPHA